MKQIRDENRARRHKLSAQLHSDLLNSILSGDLGIGAPLPTEHQLSDDYGVSRATVRAALGKLKDDGYIDSRRGSGTFVKEREDPQVLRAFAPMSSLRDLEKCFEARSVIESEIAAIAAERRGDADVAYFADHLREMKRLLDLGELHTSEDTAFHLRLATITDNPYFKSILGSLRPHILIGMNITKTLPRGPRRVHVVSETRVRVPVRDRT